MNTDAQLRQYLLGASAPEAQSAVEENLFQEIPDFLERIALLEDELIDEYVFGQLAPDEAAKFEQHFLCTEERRQKLAFSQSLRQFAIDRFAAHSSEESASARLSFLAVLRAHRWQVYCAVALLFASLSMACVVFYRSKQAELLARVEQADAEIHRLQQESRPASTPGVDARNQTDASRAIPGRPSTQSPGSYQVAVTEPLTLDAGLTRGSGQLKRLKISAGTNLAQITLRLTEPLSGAIHESLLTADQQEKWSQTHSPSDQEMKDSNLSILIPAYILTPNDYQIVLSKESDGGMERIATYTFRVSR